MNKQNKQKISPHISLPRKPPLPPPLLFEIFPDPRLVFIIRTFTSCYMYRLWNLTYPPYRSYYSQFTINKVIIVVIFLCCILLEGVSSLSNTDLSWNTSSIHLSSCKKLLNWGSPFVEIGKTEV